MAYNDQENTLGTASNRKEGGQQGDPNRGNAPDQKGGQQDTRTEPGSESEKRDQKRDAE